MDGAGPASARGPTQDDGAHPDVKRWLGTPNVLEVTFPRLTTNWD